MLFAHVEEVDRRLPRRCTDLKHAATEEDKWPIAGKKHPGNDDALGESRVTRDVMKIARRAEPVSAVTQTVLVHKETFGAIVRRLNSINVCMLSSTIRAMLRIGVWNDCTGPL